LNPKKRKHQETHVASSSTEELWKGESSARGSWQEKDAGMLAFYLKETETWMSTGQEAWEQKQEEHDWEKELDYERAVCPEAYDLQKAHDLQQEQDLQKEQDYDDFLQEENNRRSRRPMTCRRSRTTTTSLAAITHLRVQALQRSAAPEWRWLWQKAPPTPPRRD